MIRVYSLLLRALTLFAKLGLVAILAKSLSAEDFAIYGLLTATLVLFQIVVSCEFYTFAHRELLSTSVQAWPTVISNLTVFYTLAFAFIAPLSLLVFALGLLPWHLVLWFLVLLLLEHVAMELTRLLVTVSEPGYAATVAFLRSGLWALVIALVVYFNFFSLQMTSILSAWSFGLLTSCLVGLFRLKRRRLLGFSADIDWVWIRSGLVKSVPFWVATACTAAVLTLDRYTIEYVSENQVLAAYILFVSIANALLSGVDAAVISIFYPKIVKCFNDSSPAEEKLKLVKRITLHICALVSLISVMLIMGIHPFLHWLQKPEYWAHVHMFYGLLLANAIYCLTLGPHLALYSMRLDWKIAAYHVLSLVIFLLVTILLIPLIGHNSVIIGLIAAYLILLTLKTIQYWKQHNLPICSIA